MTMISLATLSGYWKTVSDWITGVTANTPGVQISSMKVQENAVSWGGSNSLSITDTSNHDSATMDISSIGGRKCILVQNNLNQQVTISLIAGNSAWTATTIAGSKQIAANAVGIIAVSDIPLLEEPVQKVAIRAQCNTAPTTGSLSAWIEGV